MTTSTMRAIDWQAQEAENTAKFLAHWVKTTDKDKLDWKPTVNGNQACRTVYEQIDECATICRYAAAVLKGESPAHREEHSRKVYGSADEAAKDIVAAAKEFADALRPCDDSVLSKMFDMPWGPTPGAFVLSIVVANMQYHGGQINAVQMMLGDDEFHFPRD